MQRWFLAAAFFTFAIVGAHAAKIQRQDGSGSNVDLIFVNGVIQQGDDARFRQIAATYDKAVVVLNSEGGAVVPALGIGRTIRLKGFGTAVGPKTLCASACALIWLAGSPRLLTGHSYIGFHASYSVDNGEAHESGVGNALVGAYLDQLGLSQDAIVFVTSAPPEGMEWLTFEKARQVNIPFIDMSPKQSAKEASAPEPATKPFDPLGTVMTFYRDLSAADGDAAAALVIPEKRGIGPFNEDSIHSFFGGLAVPLKLTSLTLKGDDRVRVSYEYTKRSGEACKGRADVDTVFRFGKTLIKHIRALDGC